MPDQHILSRSCIRDTLLAKRDGAYRTSGLALSLYVVNIHLFRSTQLAPCKESAQPRRYLRLAEQKKAAHPYVKVFVADYDHPSSLLDETEEHAAHLQMHTIYPREE